MKRPRTFHRNGKVSPICPNLGLCILDVIKLPSLLTPLLADRVQFQPRGYVHPAGVNFGPPQSQLAAVLGRVAAHTGKATGPFRASPPFT